MCKMSLKAKMPWKVQNIFQLTFCKCRSVDIINAMAKGNSQNFHFGL